MPITEIRESDSHEQQRIRKSEAKFRQSFKKINNFISRIYIFIQIQTMAEEENRLLKQKLENYQIEYDNYKIECKQIESFLEEEAQKKQNQIRQLKQQAIKKQKQIGLMKTQINVLQLQNKQLKQTIQQLQQSSSSKPIPQQNEVKTEQKIGKQQKRVDNANISGQLDEANKKIAILQSQNQTLQLRFKESVGKYTEQIHKLNEVVKQKSNQIEQLRNELEILKSKNNHNIISQPIYTKSNSNSQITTPKSNKNMSFQLTQEKVEQKRKGGSVKKLEIKIERTGKNGSGALFNQEKYQQLQELYRTNQKELAEANDKIGALQEKINEYETHICQLENQLQHLGGQQQLFQQPTFRLNQNDQNNQYKTTLKRSNEEDDQYDQAEANLPSINVQPTFCVLIVAKKFYKSPFMEIEQKKNIKLYKADKGGRIQKSLGSYKYKLNTLTYNLDSLVTKTIQGIHKNIKNQIKSRVLIFGAGKTNKKAMMSGIVSHIKNMVKNSNSHQSSHKSINQQKHYVKFLEVEDEGVINMQLQANNKSEVMRIMEHIQKQGYSQQNKTNKKNNSVAKEKKIRYFVLQSGNIDVEIITSNFLDPDIKQADGLTNAINKMTYSKIPEFSLNNMKDENSQTQIILAINPILGCYEQCRQTLKIANCKRKRSERVNINDWRQSPSRELYLQNSRERRMFRMEEQSKREVENITIFRLNQLVEYYKSKFRELVVEIKVILNTSIHVSYLKKSPAILNLEKILRFIQNALNQNQSDILSLSRSRNGIEIQDEQTEILT